MLRTTALCSLLFAASQLHAEPILYSGDGTKEQLFSAQLNVDQTMPYGDRGGHDMFLQSGTDGQLKSRDVKFDSVKNKHHNYTFDDVFSWSLTRDGNSTEFKIGNYKLKNTSLEGEWNALSFDLINAFFLFDDALLTLSVDQWNSSDLEEPLVYALDFGYQSEFILMDDNQDAITSVKGTISFDADISWWAKYFNDSPNEMMSSTWTAYNIYDNGSGTIDLPGDDDDLKDVSSPLALIATLGMAMMLVGRLRR